MKRLLATFFTFTIFGLFIFGQENQEVGKCNLSAGEDAKYMKDYRIKLPEATNKSDLPSVKVPIMLLKNQNYRFTMCNDDNSTGELYITILDKQKTVSSSFLKESGKVYSSLDFPCKKTGQYTLNYSFKDGNQGVGVGIVSLVR